MYGRLFLVEVPRQKLEERLAALAITREYDSDVWLSPVAVIPCPSVTSGERVRSNGSSSKREARGSLSAAIAYLTLLVSFEGSLFSILIE